MTLEKLLIKDASFNSSIFLSKANNLLKMMYDFMSSDTIDLIKPFVSEEVFKKIENKVNAAKNNGEKLNYEEVNVSCEIKDIVANSTNFEIVVHATVKYLRYYTSIDDGHFIRGNSDDRLEVIHIVTFQKENNIDKKVYNCLGCGAPIDIRDSVRCSHCGRMFDFSDFDFTIKSFE